MVRRRAAPWTRALGVLAAAGLLAACNPLARPSLNAYRPLQPETAAVPVEGEVTVRFGGTSTLVLSDGADTILIDGFFTRPSTLPMLFAPLRSNEERVERDLEDLKIKRWAPGTRATVQALFVAHPHHDHAMDSALVAKLTGAEVIGSSATGIVVRDQRFEGVFQNVEKEGFFRYGGFAVKVIGTPHAPKDFKPLQGKVTKSLRRTRWMWDYKASTSHAYFVEHRSGRRILIVPSAGYDPKVADPFAGITADVVFLSVAKVGLKKVAWGQEYWCRTVFRTGAGLVVPIHWDDIRRPLKSPFKTIPRLQDNFHRGMRILMPLALRDGVELRLPKVYDPIDLERRRPAGVRDRTVCPRAL